jgi:uncharacterized protein (DUF2147 family)
MKKSMLAVCAMLLMVLAVTSKVNAQQKDQIEKLWYNQEKTSMIEVYLAKDGKFYGKIYKLKEPLDKETGKPRTDKENPDKNLRSAPLQGLLILKGFKVNPENKNEYIDGTVYDPKNGKTYCGKMTLNGKVLDLRGFLCSLTFLGRTSQWTAVDNPNTF